MNRAVLALTVLISALPITAHANVGARTQGGQRAGEPAGIVEVAITHEELVIDLRPLEQRGRARVTATYHLDNRADAKHLDLVFASGADQLVDFRVTIDQQAVASRLLPAASLPASWHAPTATPLPDGGSLDFTLRGAEQAAGFQLDVAPGPHVLAIAYAAETMTHHADQPTLLHQFAYVLSPARTWAGFGGLDVTVLVPPSWTAALAPAMPRTGDTFEATFPSIPADAIAVTVSAPLGAYRIVGTAAWGLLALVTIGGGVMVHRYARARERRRARAGMPSAPGRAAFGLGAGWATAFLAASLFMIFGPTLALPASQVDHRGYGNVVATLFFVVLSAVVFGFGLGLALRAGRRGHAAAGDDR